MSKYVVVVFPQENKAYEGTRALAELHAEGSLAVYGMAVIAKETNGSITIKRAVDVGPLGFGVGALIGGLLGLLGGPVGAAVGMSTGALIGGISDINDAGVGTDFLDVVSEKLTPGKTAIIAEVAEADDWVTPLDTRMEALGGEVFRKWRYDFEDERSERLIKERQAELAGLQAEWSRAAADRKAKLKARIDETQAKLDDAGKHVEERMRQVQQEGQAKLQQLEQQAAKAKGDAKAKIDERIAVTRADNQRRNALLKQAWELTKKALAA